MDFVVDYQTYAMADDATAELPEPEPRLNLTSDTQSQSLSKVDIQFKLPNLQNHSNNHTTLTIDSDGSGTTDLYKRMTHYAMSSIDKIQLPNPKGMLGQNSLSEKLSQQESHNFTNYESKNLDLSKLVSPPSDSSKNTTNLVLSNKLSKILNNYTLTNYQATVQPVSYTHLDVYKRQLVYYWPSLLVVTDMLGIPHPLLFFSSSVLSW